MGHLGPDHELDAVLDGELSSDLSGLDEVEMSQGPGLVFTVVAVPKDDWLSISVCSSSDVQALASFVSDGPFFAIVEVQFLEGLAGVFSEDSKLADLVALACLVRQDVALLDCRSNGSGSMVISPPCTLVYWVRVLDSYSELVTANVLVPEELAVASHSGFDQEFCVSRWCHRNIGLLGRHHDL